MRNVDQYGSGARGCHRRNELSKQKGFTIVELLVGLVLGLILIGGVLNVFLTNRQTFRVNENLARMQENARLAFELMVRETREAGMTPCGSRLTANVLRTAGSAAMPWWADTDAGFLRGFDGTQTSTGLPAFGTAHRDRVAGTDAVVLLRLANDERAMRNITAHSIADEYFQVPSTNGFSENDVIVVCDGKSSALLQIGPVSSSLLQIDYGLGTTNCTTDLGEVAAQCATPAAKTFDAGAIMMKWEPAFWYVGVNEQGTRSLFRSQLRINGTTGAIGVERLEMVPGIQDLQIDYLTRNRDAGNVLANAWLPASNGVFSGANGWTNPTAEVVAVRMTLTLRSEEAVGTDGQPLQRQLIAVASLRNRDL